jgi:hypothetical protein
MGIDTNIYANNMKYKKNYNIGLEYEDLFFEKLKEFFSLDPNFKIIQTGFYDYNDFKIYKNDKLVYTIELKCRINDTSLYPTLMCDKIKLIDYQYDDEINESKKNNIFGAFLLINNCKVENKFYYNNVDKLTWNNCSGNSYLRKNEFIVGKNENDVFEFIESSIK